MRIQSFEELSLVRENISKTKAANQGNIRIIVYGVHMRACIRIEKSAGGRA